MNAFQVSCGVAPVYHPTKVISLHRGSINDLKVEKNFLFSCSDDGCLVICSSRDTRTPAEDP